MPPTIRRDKGAIGVAGDAGDVVDAVASACLSHDLRGRPQKHRLRPATRTTARLPDISRSCCLASPFPSISDMRSSIRRQKQELTANRQSPLRQILPLLSRAILPMTSRYSTRPRPNPCASSMGIPRKLSNTAKQWQPVGLKSATKTDLTRSIIITNHGMTIAIPAHPIRREHASLR